MMGLQKKIRRMIMDTLLKKKQKKEKREKEKRKNDHHIYLVEERYQCGSKDPEWTPTGDSDGDYRIYGYQNAAVKWMKADYPDADPKNLRVRKYQRVNLKERKK